MINWKLAVLLLGVVVVVSALDDVPNHHHLRARRNEKEEVVGPSTDHEQVKPFEFLGNGDNLHRRVARRGGPVGSFGPRPEPGNAKPFEALGTRNEHQPHDGRAVHSGDKNFALDHGSGHRVARDAMEEEHGPAGQSDVKPFVFLGGDHGDHHRVARNGKLLGIGVPGPRPEPMDVKPFEFLGTKNDHHRVARANDEDPEPARSEKLPEVEPSAH